MPELPEVETVRRGLSPHMVGAVFDRVDVRRPTLRTPLPTDMAEILEGRTCQALRRRGKYLLWDIEGTGRSLVCHLGMSGSLTINPQQEAKHDHVIFDLKGGDRIVYNDPRRFGMMFFVETGAEDRHPAFASMGAEPLGNDFHGGYLAQKFNGRKTPVKNALLDQHIVAGIGNIYACEALYMAGIHPVRPAQSLTHDEIENLVQAMKTVLQAAIDSGGSTLRDHRQADGTLGYFQHDFKVYGKAGEFCPETGGVIERRVQAGRSTFFCAAKQK